MPKLKLIKVQIQNFKNIIIPQSFDVDQINPFIGVNEAGKTTILEALAKFNYFDNLDTVFKFNELMDYPRVNLNRYKKEKGANGVGVPITCTFEIESELHKEIKKIFGENYLISNKYEVSKTYENTFQLKDPGVDFKEFILHLNNVYKLKLDSTKILNLADLSSNLAEDTSGAREIVKEVITNKPEWDKIGFGYIFRKFISSNLPKFWYYDEYFNLPAEINLNDLKNNPDKNKTANALLELSGIDLDELIKSTNFEEYNAMLEATSGDISGKIFKYWSTNTQLMIEFKLDKVETNNGYSQQIIDQILKIRVNSLVHHLTLPLDRRSKGFNWFFSFLVWFSKIESNSDFILLLDEPGLNLHAKAQADLLEYIEELGQNYQVLYTTHSPFMIKSDKLSRVKTITDGKEGAKILQDIANVDRDTLFPLQAALGYEIAQNLFISDKNLLVEGAAEVILITLISALFEKNNKEFINKDIVLVPVGGADKVVSFISLFNGNGLKIACLLDTPENKSKERINSIIANKIIKGKKIHYFDELFGGSLKRADMEDLFSTEDYLKIFNLAFENKYGIVDNSNLDSRLPNILPRLNKYINEARFNHYLPIYELNKLSPDIKYFSNETIKNFEEVIKLINLQFE